MMYSVEYRPEITEELEKQIKEYLSPFMVSFDTKKQSKLFSLHQILSCIDSKYLTAVTESDIYLLNSLSEKSVSYIKVS